jgi:hypothetical protein
MTYTKVRASHRLRTAKIRHSRRLVARTSPRVCIPPSPPYQFDWHIRHEVILAHAIAHAIRCDGRSVAQTADVLTIIECW